MNAVFQDLNDEDNPMNGTKVANWATIRPILDRLHFRCPFMIQLQLEDNSQLDIGLSTETGCVQHMPSDGLQPYRMATTNNNPPLGRGDTEFFVGGTATPIDNRYCLPLPVVEQIVESTLEGKSLPEQVTWESV